MRVDFTNLGLEPPDKNKAGRAGQSNTAAGTTSAGQSSPSASSVSGNADQTRFSFSLARVESLKTGVLAAPEVRQERVAPLEQAVANGIYKVEPVKVADAMVSELSGRIR